MLLGSFEKIEGRPTPGRRTRPGIASPEATSRDPVSTVERDMPVQLVICATPRRPHGPNPNHQPPIIQQRIHRLPHLAQPGLRQIRTLYLLYLTTRE